MTMPTTKYHSRNIPIPLRFGRSCVVITDADTPETIRKKITTDVGYLIDMRTKNFVRIDYILNQKPEKTEEIVENKKTYNFY